MVGKKCPFCGEGLTRRRLTISIFVKSTYSRTQTKPGRVRLVADTARLRHEVGFAPRYDLDRGLADAVEWWRGR